MSELILIVEDERDLVATLEYALEREGYRARSAYTGRQGLEIAKNDPAKGMPAPVTIIAPASNKPKIVNVGNY